MYKKNARQLAKDIIMNQLSIAYYRLEDSEYNLYSEKEKDQIITEINKIGERVGKMLSQDYYTQ